MRYAPHPYGHAIEGQGNAMSFADAVRQLPLRTPEALLRDRGLIVVAPHPDDESLGCGGLLAWAAQHAVPVRVLFLTDGEHSHPGTQRDLGGIRRREALQACGRLGIGAEKIRFLGLPDSGLETLDARERQRAMRWLRERLAARGPSLVAVTAQTDTHSDHRAAYALVKQAIHDLPQLTLASYPVWSWLAAGTCMPLRGVRVPVAAQRSAKRHALAAYISQQGMPLDVPGFHLPPELLRHVDADTEVFLSPVL